MMACIAFNILGLLNLLASVYCWWTGQPYFEHQVMGFILIILAGVCDIQAKVKE